MINRPRSHALGVVLTATVALAACTDMHTPPAPNTDGTAHPTGRAEGALVLGDLDTPRSAVDVNAPIDPCELAWTDFPASAQPTDDDPPAPRLMPLRSDDLAEVSCRYDHNRPEHPRDEDTKSAAFTATIVWGTRLQADPATRPGSVPARWNDRLGLRIAYTEAHGAPACLGMVTLSRGAAGVTVIDSRSPDSSPCAVVDTLLDVLTARAR